MLQGGPLPQDSATARNVTLGLIERLQWRALLPHAAQLAIILGVAFLTYRLIKLLTRRLEREVREQDPIVKRMREQRARTIASLLNNIALIVITASTALMVLSTVFDIKTAPLLAGLGVFGLAISFGAQSLVKDVITGMFLLVEGQFGIGDVIRIGETAGLVEKITLRTTTLRDLEGVVHIIPNGEITMVSNLTKTWSRSVLDVGVAYKEDVDRVIQVLRDIATRLTADPEWSALLIEEPEVLGIQSFADSAVVIRVVTKTLPLKQWDVAREFRRRIKKRFDEEAIEIPFPHVTFYWGEGQRIPAYAPASGSEREPVVGPGTAGEA